MMSYELEVCIDNVESLSLAIEGGATRIELCSSLALGGLTPSLGMMKYSGQISTVPIYAMIRPRQGDFLYQAQEIAVMLDDIDAAAEANLQGVVLGTLTAEGDIDSLSMEKLVNRAQQHGLGVTFHRAIDQCRDFRQAIAQLIDLGCERILTSGQAQCAEQGIEVLSEMVRLAKGKICIMAGAGLNADNVATIIQRTGVQEVHLSGKTSRPSLMQLTAREAKMGASHLDDFVIPITSSAAIAKVAKQLRLI